MDFILTTKIQKMKSINIKNVYAYRFELKT